MLINEYAIGKIMFALKITKMWGSGNKVTYELEGHRFLPRAGVFF